MIRSAPAVALYPAVKLGALHQYLAVQVHFPVVPPLPDTAGCTEQDQPRGVELATAAVESGMTLALTLPEGTGSHAFRNALEADWRAYWAASGKPRLRSPDRAFLGYVRVRAGGAPG